MKRNTAQFATQLSDIPFPSTEHLERQFLTDAVYNPESIGDVLPLIRPDMFSQDGRRKIWENLVSMFNGGERIDLVSAFAKCGNDLTTEVGRMDIKARGNDTMLVTMNVLGGDVYVFDAELTPGGFRLLPSIRTLRVGTLPDFQVTVSGEAFILDGLLNVNLVYSGSRTVLPSINYTITDCNVVCVASKN